MSTYEAGNYISLPAGAAIGTAFIVVHSSGGSATITTTSTTQPIGIAQGTVAAGDPVLIQISGKGKLSSSTALTDGQQIAATTGGQGVSITLDAAGTVYNYAVGRVMTASGAANGLAEVFIYPGGQSFLV